MEAKQVREVRYNLRQLALRAGEDPMICERVMWEELFEMLTGAKCYVSMRKNEGIAFEVALKEQGPLIRRLLQLIGPMGPQQGSTISGKDGKTHPPQDVAASSEHGEQHGRAA